MKRFGFTISKEITLYNNQNLIKSIMTTYVKQYGIQRSCTNFVKILLENNLEDTVVLTNVLGWKHGPHNEKVDWDGKDWDAGQNIENYISTEDLERIREEYEAERIQYIVCLKDPYAWLLSYSKYSNRHDKVRSLRGLVSEGQKFAARKRGIQPGEIGGYLEKWNLLHRSWAELNDENSKCTTTKFEDLLENPQFEIGKLANFFNAQMKEDFYLPEKRMKRGGEKMDMENATEDAEFDRKYYTEKRYQSHFNEEMLAEVRKHIDLEVAERLGYNII
jgi:hypothetical protein